MTAAPPRISRLTWLLAVVVAAAVLAGGWFLLHPSRGPVAPPLPVWATTPDFQFTAQTGAPVSRADLAGKIWVAAFIFTRCAGPCPAMTERMAELQRGLGSGFPEVRLVSVSVDPAHDQPDVLARYAARFGADPARWLFLTGEPAAIEKFVTKGMLLPLAKDGEGAPIHSQKFLVVDGTGRIRSFRDLDDPALVPKLLGDIENLRAEKPAATPARQP